MIVSRHAFAAVALTLAAISAPARAADPVTHFKFDFGAKAPAAGYTAVLPTDVYSKEKGFGFEQGATLDVVDTGGLATTDKLITSAKPFYFSVAAPEGNYRVTITAGSASQPTELTVKTELRRLQVEKFSVPAGKTDTVKFIVNTRVPTYPGGRVGLKQPRETVDEAWAWDDRITLEFNNTNPNICAVEIEKVDVPTIYLLGDSTMCDQSKEPWNSWGQMFPRFFKDTIAIANHAESGESVASSVNARRFEKVYSLIKPGDYLLFAYGHNDMKGGSIDAYKAAYTKIIAETKKRGATPIVVSSMERKGGMNSNTLQGYPEASKTVAEANEVAYIDLHSMSQVLYKGLGSDLNAAFQDGTHNNNFGSYEISKCVLEGIRERKLDIVKHIRDDVAKFDPAKPDKAADYKVPASPNFTNQRPLGD